MKLFEINMPHGVRLYKDNTLVFFNRNGNPLGVAGETLEQAFVLELMTIDIDADISTDELEACMAPDTAARIHYKTSTSGIAYREIIFYTDHAPPLSSATNWASYIKRLQLFFILINTPQHESV